MRKFQALLFAAFFLALASTSQAFNSLNNTMDTGPFYIPGSSIEPGQHFISKFDHLPNGVDGAVYNLKCFIKNINFSKQYPVVLKIWTREGGAQTLNGHVLNRGQGQLNQLDNIYEAKRAWVTRNSDSSIAPIEMHFINMDNSDSIYIEYCLASLAG